MARIIIVEDEAIVAMEYKNSLTKVGYEITATASTAKLALIAFAERNPDLLLIDIKLKGDIDGIELAIEIRKESNVPILFLTGNTDQNALKRMESISNSSFLGKPILNRNLHHEISKLLA
jgi:DNA-binding response OmpR family regulator